MPAPNKGINAVDPLATLGPEFCISSTNLVPDGRGMRVRTGYREFATAVGSGGIRTMIQFDGANPANDRLFATTSAGIFDVTAGGAGPWTADVTFAINSATSGIGVWNNFVLDSGSHQAFYADEANGLFRRPGGGTWAPVTDITFPTATTELELVFCMQFKSRMWFIERNSSRAWYLASGAISGAATAFEFGNKFKYGGSLVALYNWTLDGGDGIDDYLVAVGSGGDVVVYRGSDPSSTATWEQTGLWYIGGLPSGRRIGQTFGGDLYLLSQYGVLPMTRLVSGRPVQEQDAFASRNISPLIVADMNSVRTQYGWEIRNAASENVMILSTPKIDGYPYKQYVLSTQTNGWGVFEGLPYNTGVPFNGTFYFANFVDNVVYRLSGTLDGTLLDGTGGAARPFTLLTTFSEQGELATFHRVQFMRPVFIGSSVPGYNVEARYDYDLELPTGALTVSTAVASVWDSALWDSATWAGTASVTQSVSAGVGIGRAMAVAMNGETSGEALLLRIDVLFDSGGIL